MTKKNEMTKKYTSTYDKLCKGQNKSLKHPTAC